MAEARTSKPSFSAVGVLAGVFICALALHVSMSWLIASWVHMPFLRLGAFFDASIYIEIAKSFPLPYAPEGPDYLGHAPGYPALMAFFRSLTPRVYLHWGALALLASWVPAALSAVAFYVLCRELDLEPMWPTVAYVVANPRWLSVASTAHAESLAMLLLLLSTIAYLRGRLGWSVVALAVAGWTRFPALLFGAALAYGVWIQRRRWDLRSIALLSVPVLAFGLLNLYLTLRVPAFAGIAEAHRVFWDAGITWPFEALVGNAVRWWSGEGPVSSFVLSNATLAFGLASLFIAARSSDRAARFLAIWVFAIVGFHVCLSGEWGAYDFARLVLLAWPAALLIVWRRALSMKTVRVKAAVCALIGVMSLVATVNIVTDAIRWQGASYPLPAFTVQGFRIDTPRWFDFKGLYEKPAARARERERAREKVPRR